MKIETTYEDQVNAMRVSGGFCSIRWWIEPGLPGIFFTATPYHYRGWRLGGTVIRSQEDGHLFGVLRLEVCIEGRCPQVVYADIYRYRDPKLQVSGLEGDAYWAALDVIQALRRFA